MPLSPERIAEIREKAGLSTEIPPSALPANKNRINTFDQKLQQAKEAKRSDAEKFVRGAYEGVKDVATGVAKGGTSTILGLGGIGREIQEGLGKGIDTLTGGATNLQATAKGGVFDPESAAGMEAKQRVTPSGTGEEIGFAAEQIGEYFLPGPAASKAEDAITAASKAIQSPFLAGALRVLGTGAAQAVPAAGVKYAQTGGDEKAAFDTGVFAGATRGALQLIGEGAKAMRIPEKLYTTVFKNTKKDMLSELKANGIEKIRSSDPQLYQKLVDDGVIQAGPKGKQIINETLAEQALSRGLQGSVDTMADEVVRGTLKSEQSVRNVASNYKGTVDLPEEQFQNVLRELAQEYENVGFGEVGKEATELADVLKATDGKVDAMTALKIRRFLDRMRIAASYDKPTNKLSTAQGNLKILADSVRERVNKIPEMRDVMKDYSFYIDALDALAAEAARSGNRQVLSLIDSVFLAGAAGAGTPVIAAGAVLNKILRGTSGATGLGQALHKGVAGPLMSGGIGATSGAVTGSDQ